MITHLRSASTLDHVGLLKIAKTSPYTRDFGNRLMFSSDAAYDKGWIWLASQQLPDTGEHVLGFTCVREKTRVDEVMLYFIVVDQTVRSMGLGEKLLRGLEERTTRSRVALNLLKENERAGQFYKRLGYKVVGEAMGGLAWRLHKELSR